VYNGISSTTSTLTVGNGGGDYSFAGVIRNNLSGTGIVALTKTGTGTQTLTGSNTYTGATTVSEGTLGLAGGSLASPVTVATVASLEFTLGSPVTSTSSVNFGAGTIKVIGTPTLASHTLMTANGGFTGTPILDAPVAGYQLVVQGSQLNLVVANAAPVWTSNPVGGANASEDADYTGTLAGSVTDANNDPLTFAKISGPAWLSIAADGALSGTPTNSDVGANSFTVSVSDGFAVPVTETLEITVINTNDAPVFASNPIAGADATEDAAYTGTLAGSASDVDTDATLTYAKVSGPAWLSIAADGALSGTPTNSDVGANSFTVSVSDGIAAAVTTTLNIQVNQATYTVTYNGNGHTSGIVPADQVKVKGTALTLATNSGNLAKPGFFFAGWNTSADGTGTAYTVGATYTLNAPLTLFAHWISEADGTWLPTTGGTHAWGNATNWLGGTVARGADRTASFTPNITAAQTVNVDAPTTIGTITFTDSTTSSHNLTISGANVLTLARSPGSPIIDVTQSGRTLTISSQISGADGLQKNGAGTLTLSGNNDYTGITTVSAGSITAAHNNALGSIAAGSHTTIDTATSIPRVQVSSGITTSESFTITGKTERAGGYLTPLYASGTGTYSGTITLAGSGAIRLGGANWTGTITQSGTSHRLVFAGNNTVSNPMTINGADLTIADGTTTLNAVNGTWIGNTDIYNGTLRLGVTDAIRTDRDLSFPATTTARLDLNGKNQTVRGLITSGGTNTREVYNGISSTTSTLTVGNGGGDYTFAGVIRNNLSGTGIVALTKIGTGTQTLTGANTYTGATTVSEGTLGLAGGSLASPVTVASGASLQFTLGSPVTSTSSVNFGAGTIKVIGTPTLASHTLMTASVGFIGAPVLETAINGYVLVVQGSQLNLVVANAAPVWASNPIGGANASEDADYTGTLAGSASDVDAGDTLAFAKVSGPAWLSVAPDGTLSGTPSSGDVGANSFTVSVSDGKAPPVQATLNITVTQTNNQPTAASDPIAGAEATNNAPVFTVDPILAADASEGVAYSGQTLAGLATDADAGDSITYSKVSGPAWLAVAADGTLSGTPKNGSAGLNSFVVRATDSNAASTDATLEITVIGLPLPWVATDIGTGMLAGVTSHNAGTFTVAGSGVIGGTSDGLHFTYQTLTGDGEIIARISNLQDTGTSSRVGVMIRDSLAANSKEIFMGMSGANDYIMAHRTTTGGSTSTTNSDSGTVPNTWVRLVRSGTTITAYKSTNGTNWTSVGSAIDTTFGSTCYIGMAVGSGSTTTLNTSQFNNVTVVP
jgi:uncharacterized repeat protein (TIGR02543 family)